MPTKHRLKKKPPLPHIDGDFELVACDLSLSCPGFALLQYHADTRSVDLIRMGHLNNRSAACSRKPTGKKLCEINDMFLDYIKSSHCKVVIRERAISHFNQEVITLNKVTGVTEMLLWICHGMEFEEIPPVSVKKYTTGYGGARNNPCTKEDVQEAIDNYFDHPEFETDDESDACAVGIAWLSMNGYIETIPLKKYKEKWETFKMKGVKKNDSEGVL